MPLLDFILSQDDPFDPNPPIDTGNFTAPVTPINPDWPSYTGGSSDFGMVAFGVLVMVLLMAILWWWYDSRRRIELVDIRPSVGELSARDVSLNKAALVQMLPYMPALIGITPVIILAETEPAMALAVLIGLVSLPALSYFYMKSKALENNKGKVNLEGKGRTMDGTRFDYFWRNVQFMTEKLLTDTELELITSKKIAKMEPIPIPDEKEQRAKTEEKNEERKKKRREDKKEDKDKEFPVEKLISFQVHAHANSEVWKGEDMNIVHAIPVRIDNKHDVYLMSRHLTTEWEFVEGEDYDYYGYHTVRLSGPELRHIATVHRVIELESGEWRDEYVPVFLVMYDDKDSIDMLSKIAPIDVTRDHGVAGLTKAIGAEERTSAGELNSITQQVMVLERQDKDLDDLSQTIGRKKAIDFINAEKRLTMFDASMLGTVSTVVAIVLMIMAFLLGYSIGG